jgi:hypothetical protein
MAVTDRSKILWPGAGLPPPTPPQPLRAFGAGDPTVDRDCVRVEGDAWRIAVEPRGMLARLLRRPRGVRLFEVADPGVEGRLLVYRARLKTEGRIESAYLELWARLAGREYFSRGVGFGQAASGTTDWAVYVMPFLLRRGQAPDLLRLNVAASGSGAVLVKDVELLAAPLRGPAPA